MGSLSVEVRTEVLCGRICDLEAENAKLRKDLEYANNEWEKESMEYLSTQDQNAKLRELVKSMYYDLTHMTFPPDWVTDYEADMRELGVEVDE